MSVENPYSAPLSALVDVRTTEQRQGFRSPQALRNTVVSLLVVMSVVSVLTIVTMALLQQSLQQFESHQFESAQAIRSVLTSRGRMQGALSGLQLLLIVATYVASGMWIYRVACNVRAFGAKGLDDSPGWAVGWYAIPFMNLQRPFRAMEQIWLASQSPLGWQKLSAPLLLRVWWGTWLAMCFHGAFVMRTFGSHHTVPELISSESILMFGQVLEIIARLCFVVVVIRLTRMQIEQHGRAATPPPLNIAMAKLPSVVTS